MNWLRKYRQRLDSRKQTVLYAPTWTPLSVDSFMAAVHELSNDFNVLIKMHHNTVYLLESARRGSISGHGVCYLGANDDLGIDVHR